MEQQLDYSDNVPSMSNETWESDASFEYSLISGVWKIAEKNLNSLFKPYQEFTTCQINKDDLLDWSLCGEQDVDSEKIADDLMSPIIYISFWLLVGLIFTIAGIVWCLCNKCNCCCGRRRTNGLIDLVNTDPEFESNSGFKSNETSKIVVIVLGVLMGLWIIGFT
jgi:hypothetical protein